MTNHTVHVGYICPFCERRVTVLSSNSTEIINRLSEHRAIEAKCLCGDTRTIRMVEVQTLTVWRENAESAVNQG